MKKLQNLIFACLLTLGLAACANDDKSSNAAPIINTDEEVTLSFEAKLNESAENTITFTNPHLTDADLDVSIYNNESSIVIDTVNTTCNNIENINNNYTITSRLAAGESCEIKYTYTPTQFATKALELNIDYNKVYEAVCPTPNYVPSLELAMTANKYVNMTIYNYAVDSNGTKSPDIINVEINPEWNVSGYLVNYTNPSHYSQKFNLPAKKGEYLFNNYGIELTSNNNNCSISGSTLTVNNDNGCSLTLKTSQPYDTTIPFTPKEEANPYYNVNVNINSNYTYVLLSAPDYNTFEPEYVATNLSGDTDIYAGLLSNNEKITSYAITGTNKDKFKVVSTKHNGCKVTDTEISIPADQENCFFTVEIADIKESGDFTATLNTTSSTNGIQTYNIQGEVSLTLNDMLSTYCQQNTQSKKLFN
ncbi:MAG: hypothetical protein SPF17_06590 [Candidatus Mucispirillum faecigallinarum]|nr:hypothetical protein [Candidatus Mucispirillum faecigallinarum]